MFVNKDYKKSLKIISYFRANPNKNPVEAIIPGIFTLFQRIFIANSLSSKTDQSLNMAFGNLSYPVLTELRTGMAAYNLQKAVKGIDLLREYDAKTKGIGSYQNKYDLLQELVFKIVTL